MRKFSFQKALTSKLASSPVPDLQADITVSLHATLKGEVAWELYDPATDQVVQSGQQSNLILNQGLDNFASSTSSLAYYDGWRDYFCVGEGSAAPSVTQTTLGTERARSNSNGGFTSTASTTYDSGTKKYRLTASITRVITFAVDYNLTEFGFANASSGGLSIRELFRDGSNNPIIISETNGKQLRMTHTLTVDLSGDWTQAASLTVTGVGATSGIGSFFATNDSTRQALFRFVFLPSTNSFLMGVATSLNALPTHGGTTSITGTFANSTQTPSIAAYSSGTYQRSKSLTIQTSECNGTLAGILIRPQGSNTTQTDYGYLYQITAGGFTKSNTQTLSLTFTVSWGRAS